MIIPIGTVINVGMVLAGTLIGVLVGDRMPERIREIAMQAIGLITIALGIRMTMATQNVLITLGSVVVGAALGEWWRIDARLETLGRRLETRLVPARQAPPSISAVSGHTQTQGRVAQAFVAASLLFCVGPLTVLGSVNDGIAGDYQLLAIKSVMDGIASIALASALGWGVALSILTLVVVQGGITVAAALLGQQLVGLIAAQVVRVGEQSLPLGAAFVGEMTASGGVALFALGLVILDLKRMRVANLLPALAIGPLIVLALFLLEVPIAP